MQIQQETATESLSTISQVQPGIIQLWVPAFFGDSNRRLKEIQRDTYPALAYELFDMARQRFLSVAELTAAHAELADRLRETVMPDGPFLLRVYRRMAAFFRYGFDHAAAAERAGWDEPFILDREQTAWEEFFRSEARVLAGNNTGVHFVVVATAYPGVRATAAEEGLVLMLRQRYGMFTLRRRVELLKRLPRRGDWDARLRAASSGSEFAQDPQVRPNPPD